MLLGKKKNLISGAEGAFQKDPFRKYRSGFVFRNTDPVSFSEIQIRFRFRKYRSRFVLGNTDPVSFSEIQIRFHIFQKKKIPVSKPVRIMKSLVPLGLSLAICVSFYETVFAQIALQLPMPPVPLVGPRGYALKRDDDGWIVDSEMIDITFQDFVDEDEDESEDEEYVDETDLTDSSESNDWISDSQMAEIGQIISEEITQAPAKHSTDGRMPKGQIFIRKTKKQNRS